MLTFSFHIYPKRSPPWNTKDRKELFKQIREIPIRAPKHVTTLTGDFMLGLPQRSPSKRLGARADAKELILYPQQDVYVERQRPTWSYRTSILQVGKMDNAGSEYRNTYRAGNDDL